MFIPSESAVSIISSVASLTANEARATFPFCFDIVTKIVREHSSGSEYFEFTQKVPVHTHPGWDQLWEGVVTAGAFSGASIALSTSLRTHD